MREPLTKNNFSQGIELHSEADFKGTRAAGQLAAETLDMITDHVQVGVTTEELDKLCYEFITKHGGNTSTAQLSRLPEINCTSINHVVCHGIPGPKKLMNGDIINIDNRHSWWIGRHQPDVLPERQTSCQTSGWCHPWLHDGRNWNGKTQLQHWAI